MNPDTQSQQSEDARLMAALAQAMVETPRATLQDLAKAVGVSKATLYRFCRTREQLLERLVSYSKEKVGECISAAQLEVGTPLEALRRLNAHNLEHKELVAFLMYYWKDGTQDPDVEASWEVLLDNFFLRGQESGVFRIDLSAAVLTELWVTTLLGLVDAERRGRIARAGLPALLEKAFLHGIAAPLFH